MFRRIRSCKVCGEPFRSDFCGRCLAARVIRASAVDATSERGIGRIYTFAGEPSHHWGPVNAKR